jgi:hypothetical protein
MRKVEWFTQVTRVCVADAGGSSGLTNDVSCSQLLALEVNFHFITSSKVFETFSPHGLKNVSPL